MSAYDVSKDFLLFFILVYIMIYNGKLKKCQHHTRLKITKQENGNEPGSRSNKHYWKSILKDNRNIKAYPSIEVVQKRKNKFFFNLQKEVIGISQLKIKIN